MGNKNSVGLEYLLIDRELTLAARERAAREGTSTDIVVKIRPPEKIEMEEDLSKEYLQEVNHPHVMQKIRIQVDSVAKEMGSVLRGMSSRGDTLEGMEKKTSDLMESSKELYLMTASCYVRTLAYLKAGCIRCISWRLSAGKTIPL